MKISVWISLSVRQKIHNSPYAIIVTNFRMACDPQFQPGKLDFRQYMHDVRPLSRKTYVGNTNPDAPFNRLDMCKNIVTSKREIRWVKGFSEHFGGGDQGCFSVKSNEPVIV